MAMHGWRSDGISRMFAAAEKATTFEGQVSKVLNDKSDVYMPHVILLVTKTKRPKEEVIVHAGPAWFLKQQGLLINPNDIVIVTGRLLNSDENTVIATSVSKDKKTVNLRDKTGRPAWARGPHMSP
jgi:hypothetical protein